MRPAKRLTASGILAVGLVLALVSNVLAASTATTILKNVCTLTGGQNGYGYVALKVRATEYGLSGVNQIKYVAFLMRRENKGDDWVPIDDVKAATPYFANTTSTNVWDWQAKWSFGSDALTDYHRIEMFVKYLDRDGTKRTVNITYTVGKSC